MSVLLLWLTLIDSSKAAASHLDWIVVSTNRTQFIQQTSGARFIPWGFNYDHDETGRLLEEYWEKEWPKVADDFREMRQLGANVVRVHLQVGRFMDSPSQPNRQSLRQWRKLIKLAEQTGLYLDVTGLACYDKAAVPAWYDALSEEERWNVQARFWTAVAKECRNSPAIFCYDLMNEPVAPAGPGRADDWLGPPFAGKCFVQRIALETKGRKREVIARAWIHQLREAIRTVDQRHLITVGLVDWSLNRPVHLYSGFAPEKIADELDYLSVHLYPEKEQVPQALDTLRGFATGKPVVIEETFPLGCSAAELGEFIRQSSPMATGWIGFYWGRTPEECRKSTRIEDAFMLHWLELFQAIGPGVLHPAAR